MKDTISLISLSAAAVGIAIHGLGHILAARAVGVRMAALRRTYTGFRLVTDTAFPTYDAELYCALGGPMANLAAALLCRLTLLPLRIAPDFSACFIPFSLFLGLLNLLPLHSFDGARILTCLLCAPRRRFPSFDPHTAQRIVQVLSCCLLVALWLLSIYVLLRRGSALSLYVFCLQLFRTAALDGAQKPSI